MPSVPNSLLWALAVATAALYGVLAYGSYIVLPSYTGGILGFDMRPMGMPIDQAAIYARAITPAASKYYLGTLMPVDTAFIVAMVAFGSTLALRFGGALIWLSFTAALVFGAADLIENKQVSAIMRMPLQSDVGVLFETIPVFTRLKFAALLLLVGSLFVQWRRSHEKR